MSNICPMCNDGVEVTLHLLVRCPHARNAWCQSLLGDRGGIANSFASWWQLIVRVQNQENINLVAMLCWCLWNARNELVGNGKFRSTVWILRTVGDLLGQWQQARMIQHKSLQRRGEYPAELEEK